MENEENNIEEEVLDSDNEETNSEYTEDNSSEQVPTRPSNSNPISSLRNGFKNNAQGSKSIQDVLSKNRNNRPNPTNQGSEKSDNESDESGNNSKEGLQKKDDNQPSKAEELAKKAAGKAFSKATGGVGGKAGEKLAGEVFQKLIEKNKKKLIIYLAPVIAFLFLIIIIIAIVATDDENNANVRSKLYDYFQDEKITLADGEYTLVDYLVYEGVCSGGDRATCVDSNEYRFYDTLKNDLDAILEEYQSYNDKNCNSTDVSLKYDYAYLVAAITYERNQEEYFGMDLSYYEYTEKLKAYQIEMKALAINMLGGDPDKETPTNGTTCYNYTVDNLKTYITKTDGYIEKYRSELIEESTDKVALKDLIYENITSIAESIGISLEETPTTSITFAECPGVTVDNIDPTTKKVISSATYSLEDYVAGVISGEMYGDFKPETYKAFAIAVRTYTLSRTNYCKNSIENSQNDQVFNTNYKDFAVTAAKETAGLILTYNNAIFSTEYDSWDCKGSLTCSYLKLPTKEVHTVTIGDTYLGRAAGGHGRGMSQLAAADMALSGSDYKSILYYFYSDGVVISSLGGTTTSEIPSSVSDLKSRYYFTYDLDSLYRNNVYFGQCVWYAKHRAMEIIAASSLSEEEKAKRIDSIRKTPGDGKQWYASPDGSIFTKTTNIGAPKAGSIISWSRTDWGHVAIVEKVSLNSQGNLIVTVSEGWRTKNCGGDWCVVDDPWTVTNMSVRDYTLSELQTKSGTFNGYVYLIG